MLDLFKKDIQIGDKVKLYLTSGKEPEGVVIEIGDTFILLQIDNRVQNRIFDKLLGGWDVLSKRSMVKKEEAEVVIESVRFIDKSLLLEHISQLKSALSRDELQIFLEPNANITNVRGTTCSASNDEYSKILIVNSKIIDKELIQEIENFDAGSIIPVVVQFYLKRTKEGIATGAIKPNIISSLIDRLEELLEEEQYLQANILSSILKSYVKRKSELSYIQRETKKFLGNNIFPKPAQLNIKNPENKEQSKAFKHIEKEVNDLIRQSNFETALSKIEKELLSSNLESKYKSSLLLKKAQIFSSLNNPDASEIAYHELVNFNEKIKSPANNLSHLYTELARLQALKAEKRTEAMASVTKALSYNPTNTFASNLLKQIKGKNENLLPNRKIKERNDEHLIIEASEETTAISNMIDLDIKEHKYTHPELIKNGGKPTTYIAELILKEISDSGGYKITENYPSYLEVAKAFSELNVGSYELRDYLESVAYYSMLKGNSLYHQFRQDVLSGQTDSKNVFRLNESASDYYIETLNILSNIDSKSLALVLTNYLQLKVARHHIESGTTCDFDELFKTRFSSLFNSCVWSKEDLIRTIAFRTIIEIGSNSFSMWNKLNGVFQSEVKFKSIFEKRPNKKLINQILNADIEIELNASQFLTTTFKYRKKQITELRSKLNKFLQTEFVPHNFSPMRVEWLSFEKFNHLLQKTDREIHDEIQSIIDIIQPYLNRRDKERGHILFSALKSINNLIDFINANTTYYGRTFYHRVLNKWKREIALLLEEKIAQSYPSLEISIDPPYFIETLGENSAALIVKNSGEATAEGFNLIISCHSTNSFENCEIIISSDVEIAAESKTQTSFTIPKTISAELDAIELKMEVTAIYQKKKLSPKKFEFTIEKEPESYLVPEDIPWKIGHSTPENLFFGRKPLIDKLTKHYKSPNRDKPYILYGLTRTGKSSILEYLRKSIDESSITINNKLFKFISFEWQLQEVSNNVNARDFYEDILLERTYNPLKKALTIDNRWDGSFRIDDKGKFADFRRILEFIKAEGFYPIFFVDEFSYIKDLMDKNIIGKAFLAALREYSLTNLASFVFAGTYDIKKLITEEKYGITGQLVHIIEHQVDRIEEKDSENLINIVDAKLSFTPEAIEHIKYLSGNIPYFIQIICKNCGDYAVENKRRYIGYPELEKVINHLTGDFYAEESILVRLPSGTFQNNQYSTTDPNEVNVLISTICYFNRTNLIARGIGSHELEKFWHEKGLTSFKARLAKSLQSLIERKILIESYDEGIPVYKFSVDLFRRWWYVGHQDINLEIATLKNEE